MHGLNELPVLNRYSCLALERRRSRPGAIGPCKGAEYSQAGLRVFNQRRRRQACRAEAEWPARRDRL